jgi:2-amino-4-hydroxy-6-hydroxymethyldihydropteridine diphosphokinase
LQNKAYISLGSNMDDRLTYLNSALDQLNNHEKINVVNVSSIYETDPIGFTEQNLFLNMVVCILTTLDPHELLVACLKIESNLGRKRELRWGPRTVDLDILLFNIENIKTKDLIIPHPRMNERAFVLIPLLEIASDLSDRYLRDINIIELQEKEGVRLWKRKNGEDAFAPIEN